MSYYDFMHQSPFKLLKIEAHTGEGFPREVIVHYRRSPFYPQLTMGWMELSVVNLDNPMVRQYIVNKRTELALSPTIHIDPGYYLFHEARAVSHYPTPTNVPPSTERSLVKSLLSFFQNLPSKPSPVAIDHAPVLQQFDLALQQLTGQAPPDDSPQEPEPATEQQSQQGQSQQGKRASSLDSPSDEEIQQAYLFFGLERNASKEDINRAYKALAKQFHPDQYQEDPQIQAYAARQFMKANQAKQLLFRHLKRH